MARRRKALPVELVQAQIESLSHDGRGVARLEGKTVFIDNALPGETVLFRYTYQRRKFDEGRAENILEPAAERVLPPCQHALVCGGCSLQHLQAAAQIQRKQQTLAEQLAHFGGLEPQRWLAPLAGPTTGYRGKARLGVQYVEKTSELRVGFREKRSSSLAHLDRCEVLVPAIGHSLKDIAELIASLKLKRRIAQVEVAVGDDELALVFRHMEPLPTQDQQKIVDFCRQRQWHCYLQPGNESTIHRVWPEPGETLLEERLSYRLEGLELAFHPGDFIQVNSEINRAMVPLALDLLDIQPDQRVLDLFCGLGNFTLAAAQRAAQVVGIEGSAAMVQRGAENARRNGLDNVQFFAWNLTEAVVGQPWAKQSYDRVLIDPPRTGALEIIPMIVKLAAQKVVYVSCNPATLARDAKELVAAGYRLSAAGLMDMFPHTAHVESIALFERGK